MAATLPIIQIKPWLTASKVVTEDQQRVAAALHAACRDYGFFYLDLDGFASEEEMAQLTDLGKKFFHLPQEFKDQIGLAHQDGARGYQKLRENVTMGKADNHEGIDFYRPVPDPDPSKPLWGSNQWPDEIQYSDAIQGFRREFERWVERMKDLGIIVMHAMATGLGMTEDEWESELKNKVDDSFWVMRIIGYPPLPTDDDGFSCGAHKDYGCLTFLYADPTPSALQVFIPASSPAYSTLSSTVTNGAKNADSKLPSTLNLTEGTAGQQGLWLNADPIPGKIVCNIGEMWEIWSQGLYKSTLHRVVHRGTNYRVSVPFFFEPNFTAQIQPLAAARRLLAATQHAKSPSLPTTPSFAPGTKPGANVNPWDTAPHPLDAGKVDIVVRLVPGEGNVPMDPKPVIYGEFLKSKVAGNFTEESKLKPRERY